MATADTIASTASIERHTAQIALNHPWRRWWIAFVAACTMVAILVAALAWLLWRGVGVWGNNVPVTWALDIVAYDWWIGIACGSLVLAAMLLLFDVAWRGVLNRIAETTAVVAAAAAAIYPIIHLGRPWFFFWTLPYPNTLGLWPQFRSPLVWDAFDIISYLGVAVIFWYVGLLPDIARLRDRAFEGAVTQHGRGLLRAQVYGVFALGWRGSLTHWMRWTQAYRAIAVMGLLAVCAVQTGAAVMFSGTVEPGWHDTLQPVSSIASSVFSGVAVATIGFVLARHVFALETFVSEALVARLAVLLLVLGLVNIYCSAQSAFATELFGSPRDHANLIDRVSGPHAWAWWTTIVGAYASVHLFWSARLRHSPFVVAGVALCVAAGLWTDHFTLIVVTLQHDFLPSSAHPYSIGFWGFTTFVGSLGLFLLLMLLFVRYLPLMAASEAPGETSLSRTAANPLATVSTEGPIWGVSAEFGAADALLAAARHLEAQGHAHVEMYAPRPVVADTDMLHLSTRVIYPFAFGGAILGGLAVLGLCLYATMAGYVFDIGGRPFVSWPAFIVPSFSFAMLTGTICIFIAMLVLSRLPRLNHPAFNIPNFMRATRDRFFVVVEARGADLDQDAIVESLSHLDAPPLQVAAVPR